MSQLPARNLIHTHTVTFSQCRSCPHGTKCGRLLQVIAGYYRLLQVIAITGYCRLLRKDPCAAPRDWERERTERESSREDGEREGEEEESERET